MDEAHLPSPASSNSATAGQIATQHVGVPFVHGRANMVEFGNEGMLQPIDQHLGDEHGQNRLGKNVNSKRRRLENRAYV